MDYLLGAVVMAILCGGKLVATIGVAISDLIYHIVLVSTLL